MAFPSAAERCFFTLRSSLKRAYEWVHVTMSVVGQETGSAHVFASRVNVHSIIQSNVVLQSKKPSGMVCLLQVYCYDELQSITRRTAEGQFQFEVFLHHLIVYELLLEVFHLFVADVVDVDAEQTGVLDESLVVATAEGAACQDVVKLLSLESLALFLVGNATERVRGLLVEQRVGDVSPKMVDAHTVVAQHVRDGMSVILHPMLVELVNGHWHGVPPSFTGCSAFGITLSFGIGFTLLSL